MNTRRRALIIALSAITSVACSEPSDQALIHLNGQLIDAAGKPVPAEWVIVRLEGQKQLDNLSGHTDSLGEFRVPVELDLTSLAYDRLVVAFYSGPCRPWAKIEAFYDVGSREFQPVEKLAVRLVVPDKPPGRLAVGEMCGEARQANTDFTIGLAIDQITGDSVFGRFIINYSLSTRSDVGVLRGGQFGDRVTLELTGDGTGSCEGTFQVELRFLADPDVTTARIVPPIPCVIHADSLRLVSEPFSLLSGF